MQFLRGYLLVFHGVLLFSEFLFHFVKHLGVLVNGLVLFIDLLLQCASDLHHVLFMHVYFVSRTMDIFGEVLVTESALI